MFISPRGTGLSLGCSRSALTLNQWSRRSLSSIPEVLYWIKREKVPRKCLCVLKNHFFNLLDSHRRELVPVVGDQDEPCPHRGEDFPGEVLRHPRADKDDVSVFRLPSLRGPLPDLLEREEAALARLVVDDVGEGPEKKSL